MRLHRQMRAQRHSPLRGLLVGLWRLHHRCLRDGGRWRNSRGGGATLGGIVTLAVTVAEMGHHWRIVTVAEVGSSLSGFVPPAHLCQALSLTSVRLCPSCRYQGTAAGWRCISSRREVVGGRTRRNSEPLWFTL